MRCRVCKKLLIKIFFLGKIPLVNSFLKKNDIKKEKKFNLNLGFCDNCALVQLLETIPSKTIFTKYIYLSSTSDTFLQHCKETADYLRKRFNLSEKSLVFEVASNDGAQLIFFKKLGINVLGIDPAKNIAKIANQKGIPTIPEFFNCSFAKKLKKEKGTEADIIFGANILAHVPKIIDFLKGVKIILKPEGTAVFEFPYAKGLINGKFDTIYHEHIFYYSLTAIYRIVRRANLEIYDADITPVQGGSLRIYLSHQGAFLTSQSIKNLLKKEKGLAYDKPRTYKAIAEKAKIIKKELTDLLIKIKKEDKKIAGYSAPAKGNILLNYFGIGGNYLDFIVDKSPSKQGLYTPGTHILVHSLKKINEEKPDFLLVLCWNIYEEIIAMEELQDFRKRGGRFIVPLPRIKII